MLRLVLNCFAIFRQLDEKHKPGLKVENWLPWTRGQRKQRGRRVQAVRLMASVISMVGGGKNLGGFLRLIMQYLGTSRHKFSWREGEFEESWLCDTWAVSFAAIARKVSCPGPAWQLIFDIWYLISGTWYPSLVIWSLIYDTWYVTQGVCEVKVDNEGGHKERGG